MKKKLYIFILLSLLFGCMQDHKNRPYQNLDIEEVESIVLEYEYPPFDKVELGQKDREALIGYLNDLDVSLFDKQEDVPIGNGTSVDIHTEEETYRIYSIEPYLNINDQWYRCDDVQEIFQIIKENGN